MKRVLVTGATGFIGRHLIDQLQKEKVEVIAVARKLPKNEAKNVSYLKIDLTKFDQLSKLPLVDTIFHTAAFIPPDNSELFLPHCILGNVQLTANLLTFASQNNIDHFIHSSSISVYGVITKGRITEKQHQNPITPYGIAKKLTDDLVLSFSDKLKVSILRYPSVYGQGMNGTTIIPKMLDLALQNKEIVLYGTGNRTQDFVNVLDVVAANIAVARKRREGLYLIGSGRQTSLKKLAATIVKVSNSQSKIIFDKTKADDLQRICFAIQKAQSSFGFKPKISLENGIKALL